MIHNLYRALWYANPLFDILLLFVLFVRRRAASFPCFTLCTITDTVQYTVLLYVSHHHWRHLFYKLLWPLHFSQEAISLLVAFELSQHVFRPTGVWASDVRKPLLCITSSGILIAFLIVFLAHPSIDNGHFVLMWRIDLFFRVLLTVFFSGMLILSSVAGLPWKTHAMRIAQVMCVGWLFSVLTSAVETSVNMSRLDKIYFPLACTEMIVGVAGTVYWYITLWPDEPTPDPLPKQVRNQIYTLQQQTENDLAHIRSWENSENTT